MTVAAIDEYFPFKRRKQFMYDTIEVNMSKSKHRKSPEEKNARPEIAPGVEELQQEESKPEESKQQDAPDENEVLLKRVEEYENEIAVLKDQILRKQAEADNFRKRLLKDKEEAIRYANTNLLNDLITIIDDFERAIQSSSASKDFDSFYSGIELIEKQFTGMLEKKWGLKRITSVGEEFDPQKHEAIGMEESNKYKTQTVIEDYQKGYFLQDRILRPAKVKVAIPVKKDTGEEKVSENGETVADEQ